MRMFREQLLKHTMLWAVILAGLVVTGCGLRDYVYNGGKVSETVSSDSSLNYDEKVPSAVDREDKADRTLDNDTTGDADTSVSSGYYLSLGVLDENVVFNGAGRNESEVMVTGRKVIFPQGGIRSISIKSWSRMEKSYNPLKPEVIRYVDALENAEIIDGIPENILDNMVKIEIHILYLNSHGKFRTIGVTDFGNGYHEISVEKDNEKDFAKEVFIKSDTGEKYHQVFLRSVEAENIIKDWLHWEDMGKNGFETVQSASLAVNGDINGIVLAEEQLNKLKEYLKESKKTTGSPCGYENYFECIQKDGNSFHFSISADGESVSTDKNVYVIDYPDNLEIVELLKEICKAANR